MTKFSEFINDFLNIFPSLSKLNKKIFKYLHWLSKKYRCVFPCILRIANCIGCSSATVKRATALFQRMGWIVKRRCPYQSNQYFMNDEIISLNLDDPSLFFREERSKNDPVLHKPSSVLYCDTYKSNQVPKFMNKLSVSVPYCIKIQCLNTQQQAFLAQKFSEQILHEAINDVKWYIKQGKTIKNYFGIIYSRAKEYFKKKARGDFLPMRT